jgi:hypothetical protein
MLFLVLDMIKKIIFGFHGVLIIPFFTDESCFGYWLSLVYYHSSLIIFRYSLTLNTQSNQIF